MRVNAPRTAGGRTVLLLAPQVLIGGCLAACPDNRAPWLAQSLVLAHVVTAVGSVLALAIWLVRHARGRSTTLTSVEPRREPVRSIVRASVALFAVAAVATGVAALWSGEGAPGGNVHASFGLLAGVPIALHLLLDARGAVRTAAWALFLVTPLAVPAIRERIRREPAVHGVVRAAIHTRDAALYDRAEWCGSCHVTQLDEWSHSTHARALAHPEVRRQFQRAIDTQGIAAVDVDVEHRGDSFGSHCVQCHAPATFYGANGTPVLTDSALESQGIACSFCHTLRGRNERIYVSAPDTVRRYLGQGSRRLLLRQIGDLLIRWRPEAHRNDYHVAWLDRSDACAGCHAESYESWRSSRYAGRQSGPPGGVDRTGADVVECQDCHMARAPVAGHVEEPGRLVPWGADRAQRRMHAWRGGNARASIAFDDAVGLRLDRGLRAGMITLRVISVRRERGNIAVTVAIRNNTVGHNYPSGEGGDARNQYLLLETHDASGRLLGLTSLPDPQQPGFDQRETPGEGIALIHRHSSPNAAPVRDTRVPPGEEREYHLALPDQPDIARVRALIRSSFDPEPVVAVDTPL